MGFLFHMKIILIIKIGSKCSFLHKVWSITSWGTYWALRRSRTQQDGTSSLPGSLQVAPASCLPVDPCPVSSHCLFLSRRSLPIMPCIRPASPISKRFGGWKCRPRSACWGLQKGRDDSMREPRKSCPRCDKPTTTLITRCERTASFSPHKSGMNFSFPYLLQMYLQWPLWARQ